MAKVKNTLRQPLDVEILVEKKSGKEKGTKESKALNLGPREVSRDLTEEEYKSTYVQANLRSGNLTDYKDPEKASAQTETKKEANK